MITCRPRASDCLRGRMSHPNKSCVFLFAGQHRVPWLGLIEGSVTGRGGPHYRRSWQYILLALRDDDRLS